MGIKDDLLALAKATRKLVPLKLDVGTVYVRELSARQKDDFDEAQSVKLAKSANPKADRPEGYRAATVALCVCDAEGVELFDESEAGKIGELPEVVLGKMYAACQRVNGVTKEQLDEALKN